MTHYIASFSGGKDSAATIILAHLHNEPLDEIIFSEVMYSEDTSGELPEHIDFVENTAFPLFKSWGYSCKKLRAKKTMLDYFNHRLHKSRTPERNGMRAGFPMGGRCSINRDCKLKPIHDYLKTFDGEDIVQYIGIAIDEPVRLARLTESKVSLLAKYNYTEEMARRLAEEYGLLSPSYEFTPRGGVLVLP